MQKALDHFKINDPKLYAVALNVEDLIKVEPSLQEDYFSDLCDHIISQQLSGKASLTIFNRFKELFPNGKIDPELILAMSDEKLRGVGLSNAKAKYIKDLASKVVASEVILENLPQLSDEEIILELVKIKGIGRWTAEMFLMFSLGRDDIFSYGDLGLMNGLVKVYGFSSKPSIEEIKLLEQNWKPYRSYASRILWKSLLVL